jgi:polyhydroxybutyrate depolymerase
MKILLPALLLVSLPDPERVEWTVDGVAREALVCLPSKPADGKPPLVFAFHGHGGTMRHAARSFAFHERWPEAVVVYPQGLNTPGRLTDPEGRKPGWQHGAGEQGDRDLRFFDAMLASMKEKHKIDENRVYATGHSNGGGFSYLLWGTRGQALAAVAPSAAAGSRSLAGAKPLPILHVAGEKDPLVTFAMQERAIAAVKALNGCEAGGKDWAKGCTIYESPKGAPLVTFIHPGDHKYPDEAPPLIVRFFKEHARKPVAGDVARYLRLTPKGPAPECAFTVRKEAAGGSIESVTGRLTVTARYDASDALVEAGAVLGGRKAQVTAADGKARVTRPDAEPQDFDAPRGVIVTSAPDWTDAFRLCRLADRSKEGPQEFPGLWIHPDQPAQRLTFAIEKLGGATLEHAGRTLELARWSIRLRGGSRYAAWSDSEGRMIKLVSLPFKEGATELVLEGFAASAATLKPE